MREKKYKTLIHFSSSEVYGSAKETLISEKHPLAPHTPYAAGKAAADLQMLSWYKMFNSDIAIIRPFNTYGPRQNKGIYAGVIPTTIQKILKGEKPIVEGNGKQTRDFIYVTDTVRSAIDIYKNKATRGKIINIATGKSTSIKTIITLITEQLNYKKNLIWKPKRVADVSRHCADISLAKSTIHFTPTVTLKVGLSHTVKWYQENFKK